VHNQSFFYIEEQIDQKITRDRASMVIITVIRGELTAKQLEMEFTSIISAETWRWSARKISEGKFVMRFPNTKMIQEYSKFNLGMKKVDAHITVEP
jgi:predicted nucleotide-binding protein (sugar kinase/HSP70/actin superfamily)